VRSSAISRGRRLRAFAGLLFAALALSLATAAGAGDLDRSDIQRRFKPPLVVGERLRDVAAWPLTSELSPDAGPVGYAFESIDLAPIPGFEGTPMNLLVAIDASGKFIDVEVLRQHEPVFLGGLGPGPLIEFVRQYKDKSLLREVVVASTYGSALPGDRRIVLDGVAKATASVRIVNQTVLASALAVARKRLGFADPGETALPAVPKADSYEPLSFDQLVQRGYVKRLTLSNAQAEALFAGGDGAGVDDEALHDPQGLFVDLYVAYLNAPVIGRNLLGERAWQQLRSDLGDDRPAFWVAMRGRYPLHDESFVPGTPLSRLGLVQRNLPVELRDANRDYASGHGPADLSSALILAVPAQTGLDPGAPMDFKLTISRARGVILPVVTSVTATLAYPPATELFDYPPRPLPEWLLAWRGRIPDLIAISLALVLLTFVLARPRWIAREPRRLTRFRNAYLAFTLVFIGWYAQGQLSIVQLTGAIKSVAAGAGLASFLYDPVSLLLIAFTLVTLVVWGRGTFCGWLCPFGALQEFVWLLARRLKLPQARLPESVAKRLDRGRYLILATLLLSAAMAPGAAERLVEVEPFKTSITVGFDREWPYLAWAIGLLALGAFVYKFFCRFLCPLGTALALAGRLRLWRWLPRLDACGRPCQKCRIVCGYDAIARDGAIRYDRCFQCLDCVGIYHDVQRCGPQLFELRKGRTFVVHPLPAGRALKGPAAYHHG
jgi:transcriptional regulator of nitric oxide reductase